MFLVKIIKSWRTISFEEATFLSGIQPIETTIITQAALYWSDNQPLRSNQLLVKLSITIPEMI